MNWSYKTVHFELKKEGILGGAFLDETEIEEQLNKFGRSGWELISVIEVQNGVIAFFKQPVSIGSAFTAGSQVIQDGPDYDEYAVTSEQVVQSYSPYDEGEPGPDTDDIVFEDASPVTNEHDHSQQDRHYDGEVEYIEEDISLEPEEDGFEVFEGAEGSDYDNAEDSDQGDAAVKNTIGAIRIE